MQHAPITARLGADVALLIERALLAAHEAGQWERGDPMLAAMRRRDAWRLLEMATARRAALAAVELPRLEATAIPAAAA